jgi:orotate phosphoribosyltransferase
MDQNSLQSLIQLIRKLSYREGDFTLSSGKKSQFYIDLKATTLHPDGAFFIGESALDLIIREKLEIEAVGGLTLGADPLATAISLAARARGLKWPAFIVRKESKTHGTSRFIEGTENLRKGAQVLVLEDVVTTGSSSLKAIERLREGGFNPVAALTVVDREEGGEEVIRKAGLEFFALARLKEICSESNFNLNFMDNDYED